MTTRKQTPKKLTFAERLSAKAKDIRARLPKPSASQIMGVLLIIYLAIVGQRLASVSNDVDAISTEQVQMQAEEQVVLNTAAPYKPTATMADFANATPISLKYEEFTTTKFEVKSRGGSPLSSCPYRWVSVKDNPSTSGIIVGCLPPYSTIRIETHIDGVDVLFRENGNVWGLLAGQTDHWIALKTTSSTGVVTYYTNWYGQ